MSNVQPDEITHEEDIVWLEDLGPLDYVRERLHFCGTRRRRPRYEGPGRLVGYATLSDAGKSALPGIFIRRIFWLADHRPKRCRAKLGLLQRPRRSDGSS